MSCAAALLEVLHSTPRLACLPGGRDRQGRPLLLVAAPEPANSSSVCNASSSSASFSSTHSTPPPSHGDVHELQATRDHVLEQLLRYLASTLSTETRRGGLAVLVDGQQASGRQVRASVRLVELTLRSDVAALLVLRPDAFWDKQRVDCTRSAHVEGQPLYIPLSRLHKYVDQGQLPPELGGSWVYDHARWVDNRLFVESFSRDAEGVVSDLEKVRHRLTALAPGVRASSVEPALALSRDMFSATTDVTSKVLAAGAEVLLQYETSYLASLPRGLKEHQLPQDLLDTKSKVSRTLEIVRGKQSLIAQAWGALEQGCRASRELGVLEAGVARVTDWLLGVAERLLDAQQAVGRDLRAAEQLRQQHETLELQCRETYGQYAELLHKIDTLPQQSNIEVPSDLKCQRDFMDFVCRSFASRLERRRNVLITSLRFYRLVSEYFERTSNLFELLGASAEDTESCEAPEAMMRSLDEDHASIEAVGLEARREGEKLMDVLSMPVKGALGREVSVSHEADILHVQALLDAAAARRHVFCGAVQLHRLRLQQTAHVRAYEEDATQAVQWLQDLYQVMLKEHAYVGCSVMEIQTQKDAHQTFQDTAKSTYEYGLQLVGAARALRQSSVQPPHEELSEQLETAWTRLQAAATEHMTRLRVSAVFHRSVEKHCRQLQELRDAVTTLARMQRRRSGDVEDCRVRVRNLLTSREALLLEVGRMVRLGRLLRSRLREPLCPDLASGTESAGASNEDEHMNAAAVEAISERLAEVTALAEALDAALGAARHEPGPAASPSATSAHPPNDVADAELQSSPELLAASDEMAAPATEATEPTTTQQQEWYAHSGSSGDEAKTVETLVEDDDEDEFVTVSECTCTPPSGASYHTAQSEPSWWRPDDAAAALVSDPASTRPASTASELDGYSDTEFPPPPPKSPDIATTEFRQEIQAYRETVEVMTTRLRVSHSEPLGLTSYLLTSETTRECMPPTPPDSDQGSSSTAEGTPPLIQQMKESRDWIQLKVLETTPALTQLGETLQDALELQRAHDEVLVQRQSKQSPVEDLLRQVDQRISTDDPKADVYAAMADSLGMAWRDVNKLLEERKALLDLNVQYHSAAQRSVDRMIALERASHDTSYPSDAETAKKLLTKLHDLKRAMLEAFMAALQEGRALLEKLQGLENIGTLDSRPGQTRAEAQRAISQVQHWLEALHDRRRALDAAWARRKAELEQALALAMLAAELASLDATLRVRHEALARSDQLGDSASSAELLLHEHNKLLPEAKDLQEKGLRVTRATDRLVSDENQPESVTSEPRKAQIAMQAYDVLSSCSEYLHLIDQRTDLLTQTIAFFRIAQAALTKLDQLEVQVATSEVPAAQIHAQVSRTLEEITTAPLQQGHALLAAADACGTHGTEGVRRVVEELENRKIALAERCAARKQESLLVTQALTAFLERYNELYSWLVGIGEAFVQGHQDMGSVLAMAQDFLELHKKLMHDLKLKISELESLEASLPSLVVHLQPDQRSDVEGKMANLRAQWERLRILLEYRLELSERYLRFHSLAVKLAAQYDVAEETMRSTPGGGRDSPSSRAPQEEQWLICQQQLMQLNNVGENFLQDTAKETAASPLDRRDPHLDLKRARLCIETLLEHFNARQAALGDSWNLWQTRVTTFRETTVQWTRITMESTRTVEWVSRLDAQFYPLLDKNETSPRGLLNSLEEQQSRVLPEARRAQAEVELRLRSVEALQVQGEALAQRDHLVSQLLSLNQRFAHLVSEYQLLLQMLIAFFKNVNEIEKTTGNLQNQYRGTVLPVEPIAVERLLKEHEASRHAVAELFRFTQTEAEQVATRVRQQEPPAAAQNDEDVIRRTLRDRQASWERSWEDRKTQLEQHLQKCQFDADLHQLNQQLGDLATQLGRVKGQFGESLATSRANAQAFINFERTIELLERRVTIFVSTAEKLLADEHMNSSHVQQELERLQARWAALRSQVAESRRLIDLSVQYFTLVEEAEEWFREGSRLLVTIARKSTGVKSPEEATRLLGEVETFLRPGEARQNERIAKISFLASQLYGEERSRQVTTVLTENHEMLESFSIINIELTTLARNLKTADEERQRQQREMLEADASLAAARAEAEAAKAAAAAAEEVRKAAESAAKALKESAILIQQAPPPVQEVPPPAPVIPVIEPQPPLKKVKHEEIAPILVVPVFVEALRDATIQEGDKFTFECRVAGFPRPEVEWFKDGISIQNNPDYQTSYINGVCQLQIEETFSEDSAKFTCKAINDAGKAETHATLTVKEPGPQLTPPQVLKPLEDTEALEGSKHIFECTVHGYPLPTVQWFKDGTCIDASPDYTITFNNGECRLQLDEVFLEDQATFCCQASNRLGTCHTEAKLSVKPLVPSQAPAFTVPLTNIMARTGEKIKLECEVTGSPEPRITWTHDGKAVKETREVKIINEKLKSTLSISEAFPKDAGVYTAKAKNLVGGATSSCNVSVKGRLPTETSDSEMASDIEPVKPVIQMRLKDTRVEEGSPVKLDCIITGQPEPEVIWYHDGRPVKESKEVQLLFKGDRCTLVIKEALVEESGEYRVVAVNSAGEASSTCQLIVDANVPTPEPEFIGVAPKFTKLLSDVLVPEGETTKFECVAEGDPAPKITWLLNNNPVPPSERLEMKHDENSGKVSLIITNTNTIDKGVYTAKASNSLGDAKCFATLIVRSHQETPELQRKEKQEAPYFTETLIDRTVIDGDTVRFECIVNGKPTPKVKWLYNDNPVSGREFLVSTSGQRQVLTMPDVSLDRSGIVACVAENEAGKAVCQASLRVQGVPPPSELMMDVDTTEEHTESFSMRRAVFMQSSSSSTTIQGGPEGMERHSFTQQSQQAMQQLGNQPPTQMQSQRTEAVHQVNQERPVVHQQSSLVVSRASPVTVPVPPIKPALKQRKSVPPRFISPLNGRIVDQGSDVLLEGIVDGFPIPTVTWMKNGQEVPSSCETTFEHGKTTLQLHDVNVNDAGRYTCRAENEAGTASSTADLVVKKTVFPPVFGRRLQAQVVRIGDRARLEVEVTGTPEPEITWRKDNLPITCVPGVAVKAQGQCHSLVIEKATPVHTGQYSVSATNCGGQAQSIADFAVIEAAPGITLEVTRMVFEDVDEEPPATNFVVEDGKIKPEDIPLEPFPYQPSPPSQPRVRLPPPPSPSKFKKGEFRESDYESDYESQRIIPLWRPSVASDTEDTLQYRPVHPPSTPILIQRAHDLESETPLPPTQFEEPPPLSEGPLRPKFEPIEKLTTHKFRIDSFQEMQNQVVKPMALLGNAVDGIKPGSPPKVSYVEPPHEGSFSQYHNGTDFIRPKETSPPKVQQNISSNQFPKATQMETSKKVHMSESTEYSRRFVSMEHTTRVIQFGEKENVVETPLEPFPFKPDPEVAKIPVRVAPPPTPTKFIRGEFRESDYESDIDTVKIKPKWTPYDSDSEEPRYRKVQPPAVPPKSTSTPGRVPTPPTVFDTPPSAELEHQRLQRLDQMRRRFSEERDGHQAVQAPVLPAKAAQVATQQMSEMTQAFKSKAQQFMTDITTNQKPAAVKPPSEAPALDGSDPSAYREESRHSEFGSKQIDPDTGLIYFKYDFGYEFGLILPGEGKPTTLKGGGKPVYDRDEDAIEFPIIHERSKPKRVKWESESELSEVEMANQRPGRSIIPPIQRWEPSPSPTSSPSPSPWGAGRGQRPGQGRGGSQTPPSTPSTPGSTQSSQQFALSQLRKPPSFITPLKDIAATSGSTARFECIVQAEPPPNILWSKDGRIIENCPDRQMQYRNGVCRLTIPQAFPEDSGSYTCTATNAVGSACSTATLLVPGERRGRRP